jgi:cytochrome c-type biogenesis protein
VPLLLLSFFAGVLTILAPCILPLLPVIVGGAAVHETERRSKPYWIILGLVVSVILFTLLLKATTALLGVPQEVWQIISGGIIMLFGAHLLAPQIWESFSERLKLQSRTTSTLPRETKGPWGDILLGAALGPVFNSCSPTYALIVAVILPTTFAVGLSYHIAYALGLGLMLLLVALLGKSLIRKLGWAASPSGWFRKSIGILFILVGLAVITGLDKKAQAFVLEKGWYDPVAEIEQRF